MSSFFDIKKQRPKTNLKKCYRCSVTSDQRKVVEQAKFKYSSLGEAFEKQIKTIEDQGEKQIKALEEYGKLIKSSDEKVFNSFKTKKKYWRTC